MDSSAHVTRIRVRYGDTDQMGIAHHAEYLLWFETARTEMLRDLGFRYRDLEKRGVWLSVIETSCRYRAPARYDELIAVHTRVDEVRRFKLQISYEVRSEEGGLIATGHTVLGSISPERGPVRIPEDVREAMLRASERKSGNP